MNSFFEAVDRYKLIPAGSSVLVCVSGGADSMALLSILAENREKLNIARLYAFHLNHGLRGAESDGDERFVASWCAKHDITLFVEHADMLKRERPAGVSLEQWAREIRYNYFYEYAERLDCLIATAHTMNDRAETLLFQISRGAGISGGKSILPKRGRIIRPLIGTSRQEIEEYCERRGIEFRTDSSNLTDDFSRNKIRHNVLPLLEQINSAAIKNISGFSNRCLEAYRYLEKQAQLLLHEAETGDGWNAGMIASADDALRNEALKTVIDFAASADETHIELAQKLLTEGKGQVQLNGLFYLECSKNVISLKRIADPSADYCMAAEMGINLLPGGNVIELLRIIEFSSKCLDNIQKRTLNYDIDCAKIKGNIYFRSKRPGEVFRSHRYPHARKIKKLFNEAAIPAEQRALIPLLADEEGPIWIEGFGVDVRVAPDDSTVSVIRVKVIK